MIPTRQTAEFVITPDGQTTLNFLWDDLAEMAGHPVEKTKNSGSNVSRSKLKDSAIPLDEYRACRCCPYECGFNRLDAEHPSCGSAALRISSAGLNLSEEFVIKGSRGSGVIMLGGCPLHCPSCHNPEMVKRGLAISAPDFVCLAWDLRARGAHNLQMLSPTVHFPALRAVLKSLKEDGYDIPIIFKSSGYERVEEIRKFEGLVDVWLPDLKYGPDSAWAKAAGAPDYWEVARAALMEMYNQVGSLVLGEDGTVRRGLFVRHVMAPLPAQEREAVLAFMGSLPAGCGVSVMDNFVELEPGPS